MSSPKKKIALLGSTGSIGKQTLEVVEAYPNQFEVTVLTANNNCDLLVEQALKFNLMLLSSPMKIITLKSKMFCGTPTLKHTAVKKHWKKL